MKECIKCGQLNPDDSAVKCARCGSTEFKSANQQRPVNNQQRPVNSQQRPVNNQQRPVNNQQQQQRPMGNAQNQQQKQVQQRSTNNVTNQQRQLNNQQQVQRNVINNVPTQQSQLNNTNSNLYTEQNNSQYDIADEITIKKWLVILLQLAIPIWNIVFVISTLASHKVSKTMKNYVKACIIWTIIGLVLSIICAVALSEVIKNMMYSMY